MNYVYEAGNNQSFSDTGSRIYIPLTYTVTDIFSDVDNEAGMTFSSPEDMFIDSHSRIYVADTGNNRIVVLDADGSTEAVFEGTDGIPFAGPKGIFVTENQDIYVADSGNERIVQMDRSGNLIASFQKPDSDLLSDIVSFDPTKLVVGPSGYIYTLIGSKFMAIDRNNQFKGYLGETKLSFDLGRLLIRAFASEDQKNLISKRYSPSYNNIYIDAKNRFVACSAAKTDQIRIINSVGMNIYRSGFYGEVNDIDDTNNPIMPNLIDLAVDGNGIISALEQRSGKIYQYDDDGNILTVFSGKGKNKGYFVLPVAIDYDGSGNLYVLDKSRGNIQKFEPTIFIGRIHEALSLYAAGDYDGSGKIWREIVKLNADYPLAHKQLGLIYYRKDMPVEAMREFVLADDLDGYSLAFTDYRRLVLRNNFLLIVSAALAVLIASIAFILMLKRYADRLQTKAYSHR
ncbi:MAG: hypothetical protein ACYCYM_10680 [Saccharofermentanales bacterium]